ncbi:MAG TPA: 2-phospho-L-lactate transferase CofD family protein, partial [Anaerolineales bacterium]|nr:2-phospho-L-lactate transferase CofD family protein [Anaerolineales bacterium]
VPDLAAAIESSPALKVYVCNTATQPGETDAYDVGAHVGAIERHTRPGLFPLVMANANSAGVLLPKLRWVAPTLTGFSAGQAPEPVMVDLIDEARPWRHDSEKLAAALLELLEQRRSLPYN